MGNSLGMTRPTIKYGYVFGPRILVPDVPVGAGVVFTDTGGKFVWFDTSRRIEIAGSGLNPDSTTLIYGWVEWGAFTASSTEGKDKVSVDISPFSVYYIPADDTVAKTMIGAVCDLITGSDIQKADVGEKNEKYLIVVDVDVVNQGIYVRMNDAVTYKSDIV